jgi:hypothetical protein
MWRWNLADSKQSVKNNKIEIRLKFKENIKTEFESTGLLTKVLQFKKT